MAHYVIIFIFNLFGCAPINGVVYIKIVNMIDLAASIRYAFDIRDDRPIALQVVAHSLEQKNNRLQFIKVLALPHTYIQV